MDTTRELLPNGRSFFVALPDTAAATPIAGQLGRQIPTVLTHPSGRPWILAVPGPDRTVHGSAGDTTIAVVGMTDASATDLERAASRTRRAADTATVQAAHTGSFVTLGSVAGRMFASGPAMETRRVWSARIDGVTVVSDRADVLADLAGLDVDPAALALRLIGSLPHPLDRVSLWPGVTALPGDRYLVIEPDGTHVTEGTWWHLPADDVPRADGAEPFRQAVEDSVAARARTGASLACDLSGGLDSTPLCHYAAQAPQGVLARTLFNDDPGGREDLDWARIALARMPGVHTHLVSSTDELADFYEGIETVEPLLDEPTQAVAAGPRILAMLADDANRGIDVHINGLGGDHLLRGVPAWEHTITRAHPVTGWRRARDLHIPDGIDRRTTWRELSDRRTYREWLTDTFRAADDGTEGARVPRMNDWSSPMSLPPWLSEDARELVRSTIRERMPAAEPLDHTLAGHTDIYFVRDAARLVRGTSQLGHPAGVAYEAPLLDDRVAEAAFRVRRTERDTPLEWKPLMKAAMRGVLPDGYLMRTSKVGGGPQAVRGYARHYAALLGLMEDGGLFATGLVDRAALLDSTAPHDWEMPATHVHQAVNASVFLRNRARRPVATAA